MSRTLRKAVENTKQKEETELYLPDEGIAQLEDVPEFCEFALVHIHIHQTLNEPCLSRPQLSGYSDCPGLHSK